MFAHIVFLVGFPGKYRARFHGEHKNTGSNVKIHVGFLWDLNSDRQSIISTYLLPIISCLLEILYSTYCATVTCKSYPYDNYSSSPPRKIALQQIIHPLKSYSGGGSIILLGLSYPTVPTFLDLYTPNIHHRITIEIEIPSAFKRHNSVVLQRTLGLSLSAIPLVFGSSICRRDLVMGERF